MDEIIILSNDLKIRDAQIEKLTNENKQLKLKLSNFSALNQTILPQSEDTSTNTSNSDSVPPAKRILPQEVTPSNRYSRLVALQKMGVVKNYEDIVNLSIAIIGVGGVGSVAAEMLCRCGIGELILMDNDRVEMANMNRMFYHPHQCGEEKVLAAMHSLQLINSDVKIRTYSLDVTKLENYDLIINIITGNGSKSTESSSPEEVSSMSKRVSLILSCVDNFSARMAINQLCLEANQTWIEAGVSENAVSGHIQMMRPGDTACFACAPPLVVATGQEESLKKEGVCAASLPTTSAIIAGIMTQNALKYLLDFGEVSQVLAYNSLNDYFARYAVIANPFCTSKLCLKRQQEVKEAKQFMQDEVRNSATPEPEGLITQQPNEWNIVILNEVMNSTLPTNDISQSSAMSAVQFDLNSNTKQFATINNDNSSQIKLGDMSNDELSEMLKKLSY